MSRRSFIHNEHEAWERHRQRDVDVERWNPLENASTGGVLEFEGSGGVKAGLYEVRANGFITTWNGEARTVNSLLSSINSTASGAADAAQSAMARANQAWESQALKPTTLYVDARDAANATAASNAHSRANAAYSLAEGKPSQGYVVGRDLGLQAQIDWILDNMVSKPERWTDPPPRVVG